MVWVRRILPVPRAGVGLSPRRRALFAKFGATNNLLVAERTSWACLLRPVPGEELRRAVALAESLRAIDKARAKGYYPFFQFVHGLAEYRQVNLDRAISLMRGEASGVLGPAPRAVLAMALHENGRTEEARKTLAEAILAHDWRAVNVETRKAGLSMSCAKRPRP